MSNERDDSNSGLLFIHDKKGNDRAPDRRGKLNLVCPHCGASFERELAGWLRKSNRTGAQFLSLKVSEPRQQRETP